MNGTDQKVTPINEEALAAAPMWLKTLVVVLGIAIIGMIALILHRIINGPAEEKLSASVAVPIAEDTAVVLAPQDFDIAAPADGKLVAIVPSGAEVFMHFQLESGSQEVLILNRQTGAVSRIHVKKPAS